MSGYLLSTSGLQKSSPSSSSLSPHDSSPLLLPLQSTYHQYSLSDLGADPSDPPLLTLVDDPSSTLYYIPELKQLSSRPNIISRGGQLTPIAPRGRLVTVGGSPSSLTSVLIPDSDPDLGVGTVPYYAPAATCVSQSIATPVVTPSVSSDSVTLAHDQLSSTKDNEMVLFDPNSLQVLEDGAVTYLGSSMADTSQVISLDSLGTSTRNTLSIQTNNQGNLVLVLHDSTSDETGLEYANNESYILVQIDADGNTILVPTSFNSSKVGGLGLVGGGGLSDVGGEGGSILEEDRPRPFRYVLDDEDCNVEDGERSNNSGLVETHINPYLNILSNRDSTRRDLEVGTLGEVNQLSAQIQVTSGSVESSDLTIRNTSISSQQSFASAIAVIPSTVSSQDLHPLISSPAQAEPLISISLGGSVISDDLLNLNGPHPESPTNTTSSVILERGTTGENLSAGDVDESSSVVVVPGRSSIQAAPVLDGFSQTCSGTYSCSVCSKETKSQVAMINHLDRNHRGAMPFECPVCGLGFQYMARLRAHQKVEHGQTVPTQVPSATTVSAPPIDALPSKGLRCPECRSSNFLTQLHLSEHVDKVHRTTPVLAAPVVSANRKLRRPGSTEAGQQLTNTKKKKLRANNVLVNTGGQEVMQEAEVRQAEAQPSGEDILGCSVCGDIFPNGKELASHTLQWHSGQPSATCDPTTDEGQRGQAEETDFVTVVYENESSSTNSVSTDRVRPSIMSRKSRPRKVKVVPIAELKVLSSEPLPNSKLLTVEPIMGTSESAVPVLRRGRLRRAEPPSSVCAQVERDFVSIFQRVSQDSKGLSTPAGQRTSSRSKKRKVY